MPRKKTIDDQTLLQQALSVIVRVGATQFTLEDIRKETGLSPATLLQRFGTKANLLQSAMAFANQQLSEDFDKRIQTTQCPIEDIIEIYCSLAQFCKNPIDVANGLDILKFDIMDEKLNALTRAHFDIRRNKITQLIQLAQKQDKISAKRDPLETAWDLECLWQGAIMLWALIGNGTLDAFLKRRLHEFFKHP